MLTVIDAMICGFLGGGAAALAVLGVMYINFQSKYKDYFFNKEQFKTRITVDRLMTDVTTLKMQVAMLNAEAYHSTVEDVYK